MTEGKIDPKEINAYFEEKLATYGPTPQGVDWNSEAAQIVRFEQLAKVLEATREFSINDYGCGYGGLVDFLRARGYRFRYTGYDLSPAMIAKAIETHADCARCRFTPHNADLESADYTLASGIFNVRLQASHEAWTRYVLSILRRIDELSNKGFAFNLLTNYADKERMRLDLYYADPGFFFDYCKTRFSRNVALLHDYDLYDFTVIVRK